jgi:DNA-binding NarL/FixJ family response regulator
MSAILIADDHAMVRSGFKRILAEDLPGAEFGEAATVQETLARLEEKSWDALVLDIFMPGGGGFEVLTQVVSSQPRLPVLVLSSAPEEQLALRALQAGAAGYLNKQAAAQELVRALRQILSGLRYVSDKLAQRLATECVHPSPLVLHERLSGREFQVLQMLVVGKSLKQIAAELSLSPKTISTFHTRMLEKLRLQNDLELVRYALENKLVELAPTTRGVC